MSNTPIDNKEITVSSIALTALMQSAEALTKIKDHEDSCRIRWRWVMTLMFLILTSVISALGFLGIEYIKTH